MCQDFHMTFYMQTCDAKKETSIFKSNQQTSTAAVTPKW